MTSFTLKTQAGIVKDNSWLNTTEQKIAALLSVGWNLEARTWCQSKKKKDWFKFYSHKVKKLKKKYIHAHFKNPNSFQDSGWDDSECVSQNVQFFIWTFGHTDIKAGVFPELSKVRYWWQMLNTWRAPLGFSSMLYVIECQKAWTQQDLQHRIFWQIQFIPMQSPQWVDSLAWAKYCKSMWIFSHQVQLWWMFAHKFSIDQ